MHEQAKQEILNKMIARDSASAKLLFQCHVQIR